MRQSIVLVSALAGVAFAQSNTIELFFPGGSEGEAPVATVKEVSPQTTALVLSCPDGQGVDDGCMYGSGLEYTIISGTSIKAAMNDETYHMSMSMDCKKDGKKEEFSCTASVSAVMTETDAPEYGMNTVETTVLPIAENILTVSVVEGASLLAAETGAPKSSASGASSSAAATGSPSAGSSPTSSGASATGTPSNSTGTSTNAPPESTGAASKFGLGGAALLAMAGAAALNAL